MIGLTPDESFPMCLPRHKHLPVEKRPTIRLRFITGRQRIEIEQVFEKTEGMPNSVYMQKCFDAIAQHVTGWHNQPIDFDSARFSEVIAWEDLLRLKLNWSFYALDEDDQKKSS